MKKIILIGLLLVPSLTFAAPLSVIQVNAVLELLSAFGVDANTIAMVRADLMPQATSTPSIATSTPPASFIPIVQTTPTFGSVTVAPTPITPPPQPPCDDTPVITYHGDTSFSIGATDNFTVTATSSCGSTFRVDWNETDYNATGHDATGAWVYGIRRLNGYKKEMASGENAVWSAPSQPGTYTQTFIAHNGKTVGTTTVDIVVN